MQSSLVAALLAAVILLPAPAGAAYLNPREGGTLTRLKAQAEGGDAAAMALMGWSLRYGIGLAAVPAQALGYIQAAASAGHPYGLFLACEAYDDGYGVARDAVRAAELCSQARPGLQTLAQAGDAHAQYMLGYLAERGLVTPSDAKAAFGWYSQAAEQGHPFAQNNLGFLYKQGHGTPADPRQALKWFTRAAEQGDASARNNLGYAYQHGEGVARDFAAALKWYGIAAQAGDAAALNNLGAMHAAGQGVAANPAKALDYYRQAAEQGYAIAQYNLGLAYLLGKGTPIDVAQAYAWLAKAADAGMPEAQFEAARLILDAKAGQPTERERAGRWLEQAAAKGHRQAKDLHMRRF